MILIFYVEYIMTFDVWYKKFIETNPLWKIENPTWGDVRGIAKLAWQEGEHQEWTRSLERTLSTVRSRSGKILK
jgi:hypothetical protein